MCCTERVKGMEWEGELLEQEWKSIRTGLRSIYLSLPPGRPRRSKVGVFHGVARHSNSVHVEKGLEANLGSCVSMVISC